MATSKNKSAKKNSGFRVSYSMFWGNGTWKRDTTTIVYKTKKEAQKYADQLNRSNRYKNARVRKA